MKPTPQRTPRRALLIAPLAVLSLLLIPASGAAQQATPAAASLKWFVTVMDEQGHYINGLTKDAFKIFEGKTEREISYFEESSAPASVAVLLDVSGSMGAKGVEAARLTAVMFMQRAHPENSYFVGDFNVKWRDLTGWTRDEKAVAEGLRRVGTSKEQGGAKGRVPYGRTALHDACLGALEKLASAPHPKRVLFIITDGGEDNASTHELSELRRRIKTSDVLVYAIALPVENRRYSDHLGWENLDGITSLSGGRVFFPDTGKELSEVVERVAVELRNQYTLGFAPANAAKSGKWNKVKIKVEPPVKFYKKLWVRSREGYFTPSPAP
jgi:Ca-activated chloride channel family protein